MIYLKPLKYDYLALSIHYHYDAQVLLPSTLTFFQQTFEHIAELLL